MPEVAAEYEKDIEFYNFMRDDQYREIEQYGELKSYGANAIEKWDRGSGECVSCHAMGKLDRGSGECVAVLSKTKTARLVSAAPNISNCKKRTVWDMEMVPEYLKCLRKWQFMIQMELEIS